MCTNGPVFTRLFSGFDEKKCSCKTDFPTSSTGWSLTLFPCDGVQSLRSSKWYRADKGKKSAAIAQIFFFFLMEKPSGFLQLSKRKTTMKCHVKKTTTRQYGLTLCSNFTCRATVYRQELLANSHTRTVTVLATNFCLTLHPPPSPFSVFVVILAHAVLLTPLGCYFRARWPFQFYPCTGNRLPFYRNYQRELTVVKSVCAPN